MKINFTLLYWIQKSLEKFFSSAFLALLSPIFPLVFFVQRQQTGKSSLKCVHIVESFNRDFYTHTKFNVKIKIKVKNNYQRKYENEQLDK